MCGFVPGSSLFLPQKPFGNRRVESFSIICTTCQTRLRVRDESAIGQILACPKCGSMVMVDGPNGTNGTDGPDDAAHGAPGTPAAPPTDVGKPDSTTTAPPDIPEAEMAAVERRPRTFKFREDFEESDETPSAKTPRIPVTTAPPKSTAPATLSAQQSAHQDAPRPPMAPVLPDGNIPTSWNRYQQWMLIGGAAVVGIALALLVAGILGRGARRIPTSHILWPSHPLGRTTRIAPRMRKRPRPATRRPIPMRHRQNQLL